VINNRLINDVNQTTTLTSHLHRDLARAQILPKQSKRKKKQIKYETPQFRSPNCSSTLQLQKNESNFYIIIGEQSIHQQTNLKSKRNSGTERKTSERIELKETRAESERIRSGEPSFIGDCLVLSKSAKK